MDVATYETLPTTDEEILQSFLHKDDDDDDEQDDNDDPEPEPPARPSKAEVREALNVLNNWALFVDKSVADTMRKEVYKFTKAFDSSCNEKKSQATITDYFKCI